MAGDPNTITSPSSFPTKLEDVSGPSDFPMRLREAKQTCIVVSP